MPLKLAINMVWAVILQAHIEKLTDSERGASYTSAGCGQIHLARIELATFRVLG